MVFRAKRRGGTHPTLLADRLAGLSAGHIAVGRFLPEERLTQSIATTDRHPEVDSQTTTGCQEAEAEKSLLLSAVDRLPSREREIMQMRFGLIDGKEKTQKEVADIIGISQSYISRLEKRIIKKLKKDLDASLNSQ